MGITEPVTMITDYMITVFGLILAILLFSQADMSLELGIWAIAILLVTTAIGALMGGTAHGFKEYLSDLQNIIIWKSTLLMLGLSSMFFIVASTLSSIQSPKIRQLLILVAILQLISYSRWILENDEFIYAIINYLISMIVVIILKIYSWIVYDDPSSIWIIASIIVTIIGSVVQAQKLSIHDQYFNHNDLFHIIQLVALYLLYLGGKAFVYPV